MKPERRTRLQEVALRRQSGLTILLENVHDPHNLGAVIRSCDAVGIPEIFVLYTEPQLTQERLTLGKRSSAGARKWVDIRYFRDREACFEAMRQSCDAIWCAMLSPQAKRHWDLDLTGRIGLVFGNERDGVSPEAQQLCDGEFTIPMAGMAQSLNISVACAVTLFEAYRQREEKGLYSVPLQPWTSDQENIIREYLRRHDQPNHGRHVAAEGPAKGPK